MPATSFEGVPAGADAYLLKQVIHDWDDAATVAIVRNVRQAMQPDGRLLVIEFVASLAKLLDLNMLAVNGGRERTEIEYRELFAAAGLGSWPSIQRPGHSVSLKVCR